jgi:pimeloyl-ACP methyl ester carboxylesterase
LALVLLPVGAYHSLGSLGWTELMARRLAATLAADVVGYSRLMAVDEARTHERMKALRQDCIEPKNCRASGPGRQAHGRRRPGRVRPRLVCAPPFHRTPRTLSLPQRRMIMSTPSSSPASADAATGGDAIRPFSINVPEEALVDLRRRLAATRWPERETVTDQSQGVQLATIQKLARYWATEYDWRKIEAKMNALPQFITEIDGLDIHFIHVRSKHENALPLIVTHGWPGSIIEQMKIIDTLANPTAHGASASDAFHLVTPSMPGYGFSGKPTTTGWSPARIARAWVVLMKRLGYTRFVAQGGDWGALVVDMMGVQAPPELIGIHTNMPGAVPPDVSKAIQSGGPAPSGLSDEERRMYEKLKDFFAKEVAYALEMGNRPQTLYGIADSPVGLAAWILDHDALSLELISRAFHGHPTGLTRDDVLDNITLFWLTNTGISAARLYWENKLPFFDVKNVSIPVAVSVFPDEIDAAPRSWAERAYPKLIHYNKLDKGGHFAAWEQPELFSKEVRAGFRPLRK